LWCFGFEVLIKGLPVASLWSGFLQLPQQMSRNVAITMHACCVERRFAVFILFALVRWRTVCLMVVAWVIDR
jgi:hypothetical protein